MHESAIAAHLQYPMTEEFEFSSCYAMYTVEMVNDSALLPKKVLKLTFEMNTQSK